MAGSFVEYNEKRVSSLGDVYGVYALAVGLKNTNTVRVFYVGSGKIRDRLAYHLSSTEENSCIKKKIEDCVCYFWHEEVPGGEEKRRAREAELMAHYQGRGHAECNKICP